MMIIKITGASGFIGQNLLPYLQKQNLDVEAISRTELYNSQLGMLDNVDVIVHLAGKAHDLKSSSNPDEYYQVNFELTKILYDEFLKSNAKKFIFISSVKASSDKVTGVLTENNKPNPITDYGKSKLLAESYIEAQTLPAGKSYFILRPCMVHGPGNKGNLNLLFKLVQKGIPYPLASFNNKRSFLTVNNFCFIIKEFILQDNIPSGVYHIADDEALSTRDLVRIMSIALGRKPRFLSVPRNIITMLAIIGDKLKLPFNTERLSKLTEDYVVSNGKVKEALNIQLPIRAKDGLVLTISSLK